MRIFKKYAPRQIAKYVVAFFKGTFMLEGSGVFEFDGGRVVPSVKMDKKALMICKEINDYISKIARRLTVASYG